MSYYSRCSSSVDCWPCCKAAVCSRLLLLKEHRFLILPSYPNESSALTVLSYADNYLSRVFHFYSFSVRIVEQTKRNALPSNQIRSQADLLLHTLLERNKLSNGKWILLNGNSFITFLTTYWSTLAVCSFSINIFVFSLVHISPLTE